VRDTVPNALLGNIRHVDRIPRLERKSHRTPVVVLEGEDCTRDLNERVETSFATGVIANKSSKSPAGGGIIKEQLRYTGIIIICSDDIGLRIRVTVRKPVGGSGDLIIG